MAKAYNLDYRTEELKEALVEITKGRTVPFLLKVKNVLNTAKSFNKLNYVKNKLNSFLNTDTVRLLETLPHVNLNDFQIETLYQSLLKDRNGLTDRRTETNIKDS